MQKPNNPFQGFMGVRISGPPISSEADHFYECQHCGQAVDMRDLGQVFHHEEPIHDKLELDS
jgi:hypothetical protein